MSWSWDANKLALSSSAQGSIKKAIADASDVLCVAAGHRQPHAHAHTPAHAHAHTCHIHSTNALLGRHDPWLCPGWPKIRYQAP